MNQGGGFNNGVVGGANKEGKLLIMMGVEFEKKLAAKMYKELVATKQRKDQFWVQMNTMVERGGAKATIEVSLENFFDEL